ncbi:MAG: MFS transporter, partial [Pseudomonadales bacterium]|nr:MFS transporter [Pseudomonadales bacterium]
YYLNFSIICAASALVVMLIATLGTWHMAAAAPTVTEASAPRTAALTGLAHDFRHTLRPRPFRMLMYCVAAFAVAAGVQRATEIYVASYFWRLTTQNVLLLPVATLAGALAGTVFWAQVSHWIPRRTCYVIGVASYALLAIALPVAHVLQLLPPLQSDAFIAVVLAGAMLAGLLAAAPAVFVGSIIADIIDDDECQTGQRRAASFFGTAAIVAKPALGLATLLAGVLVAGAGVDADQHASQEISSTLGIAVGATIAVFAFAAAVLMYRYVPRFSDATATRASASTSLVPDRERMSLL